MTALRILRHYRDEALGAVLGVLLGGCVVAVAEGLASLWNPFA